MILCAMPIGILISVVDFEKIKKQTFFKAFASWAIGLVSIALLLTISTQKELLDNPNPYHKEYTYKQLPSGEYVKTDSSYVRIKNKK